MQRFSGSAAEWNALIAALPDPHLLQTWEWSQVKEKYGWKPTPLAWTDAAGKTVAAALILSKQILTRGFAAPFQLHYIPKGPLMDWKDATLRGRVLDDLQSFTRKHNGLFLKVEPDVVLGTGIPGEADDVIDKAGLEVQSELKRRGWVFSADQVQFRNTVLIDLSAGEEELLARMKQKTRYNVRLAMKKDVSVRVGTTRDLPLLYKMYAETSIRDGFVIRDPAARRASDR
jgi:lipid II:glycine glycyltransferase (peptidoglycan interpeptide bridge formation enzyme)